VSHECIWQVIGSSPQESVNPQDTNGFQLSRFDVIKLGRMKFRIKELSCKSQNQDQDDIMKQELSEAN
jgi:hypothetical protein